MDGYDRNMKKYDMNMARNNICKGYTRAETLEMLVDLFYTVFDSDGDLYFMADELEKKCHASDWTQNGAVRQLYEELINKLDDEEKIGYKKPSTE